MSLQVLQKHFVVAARKLARDAGVTRKVEPSRTPVLSSRNVEDVLTAIGVKPVEVGRKGGGWSVL